MARIDALAPEDRTVIRRAAVFGLSFHPRMLGWFADGSHDAQPGPATWARLQEHFDDDGDGYLRFRRSLLRDAAYEGLPYKLRRQFHGTVAARMEEEMDQPEEAAGILSLHYVVAGEYRPAWRYASIAAEARSECLCVRRSCRNVLACAGGRAPSEGPPDAGSLPSCMRRSPIAGTVPASCPRRPRPTRPRVRLVADDRLLDRGCCSSARSWKRSSASIRRRCAGQRARQGGRRRARRGIRAAGRAVSAWYANRAAGRGSHRRRHALGRAGDPRGRSRRRPGGARRRVCTRWAGPTASSARKEPRRTSSARSRRIAARATCCGRRRLLSNLGVIYQWEGRWDEALSYYERGRAESVKLGNTFDATIARMNVAEILSDRGELAEAQELLLDTLPVWRASRYRYLAGWVPLAAGSRVVARRAHRRGARAAGGGARTFRRREARGGSAGRGRADRANAGCSPATRTARSRWSTTRSPGRARRRPAPRRSRCSNACAGTRCCTRATSRALEPRWRRASRRRARATTCRRRCWRCIRCSTFTAARAASLRRKCWRSSNRWSRN